MARLPVSLAVFLQRPRPEDSASQSPTPRATTPRADYDHVIAPPRIRSAASSSRLPLSSPGLCLLLHGGPSCTENGRLTPLVESCPREIALI